MVRPIDRWQQEHRAPSFVFGVVKKYGDDRGGMLAALITFYGFLSLFPLLLVFVTVLGFVLSGNPSLQHSIERSTLSQFPVVGNELIHGRLRGNGLALAVGILGSLWGSLGVAGAVQFAFNEAWGVPNKDRPAFLPRIVQEVGFFALLGLGIVATQALTSLGSIVGNSEVVGAVGVLAALAVNLALFLGIFKLLGPSSVGWWDHLPGAVVATVGWQALQLAGQYLVQRDLRNTTQLYGQFALVLGLISFLSLASQLVLYAVEINAVRAKRMWPRSLIQPPLTDADRRSLADRAVEEERRPEQRVAVSWSGHDG
ncbi:MAG TPA: YihY/virulence factor BrkB family protein [Acidimicrobiales bacterium]